MKGYFFQFFHNADGCYSSNKFNILKMKNTVSSLSLVCFAYVREKGCNISKSVKEDNRGKESIKLITIENCVFVNFNRIV